MSSTLAPQISPSARTLLVNASTFLDKYPHIHRLMASCMVFRTEPCLQVLLLLRAAHDSYALHWEVPGGGVDPTDSTIIAGAVRELHEETGLTVTHVHDIVTLTPYEPLSSDLKSRLSLSPHDEQNTIDADGLVVSFMETTKRWGKATVLVDVEDASDVKICDDEHAAFTWVTEEEVRSMQFSNGQPLKMVSDGVRRTILHGFQLKQRVL